ncbi:MAG: hypothetical protein AB8I08_30725 [Sandaracinaceae bacterium]
MARRQERLSDVGDEEGSILGKIGCGCGALFGFVLLAFGAAGIFFGAWDRFGGDDVTEPVADPSDPVGVDPSVPDPADPPPSPRTSEEEEARRSMERRFRAGPFVTLESMVTAGRILPSSAPVALPSGQTIDNPWVVVGADLRPGRIPAPSPSQAPTVSHRGDATRALAVLPRTPSRAEVNARDAAGGTDVLAYLVEFDGYDGHFHLPAMVQTELGPVGAGGSEGATVHFTIRTAVMPRGIPLQPGQSMPVTMRIAAVDAEGRVSNPVSRPLNLLAVGAGDVEVTLTMAEPTDMDLYVTDPAGTMIYFGNRESFTGGHLDLDANAACSSNRGIDNEHIYWPAGRAPPGTYRVHVAHYESCIGGRPVDYRVTVHACGETAVYAGHYDGGHNQQVCRRATPGDRGWCQDVVTFDIPACATMP